MSTKTRIVTIAGCIAIAGSSAAATIIADGQISGFMNAGDQPSFDAFGGINTTLNASGFNGFQFTADYIAETATDGIKLSHWSQFSSFSGLRGGIQDAFTVTTDTPGEELVFNAVLRATGNSTTVPRPNPDGDYFGNSRINLRAGGDLLNASVFNGSPAIDASFGKASAEVGVVNDGTSIFNSTRQFASVDFDAALVIPLRVIAGEAFPLAVSVGIDHTGAIDTDMFNTATLTFDLPVGATITSTKGFGAPIPSPGATVLLGVTGIVASRRRR